MYQVIEGGVAAASGFRVGHTAAGIKYRERADMALLVSDSSCAAAGVFTRNVVKAAPVLWDRRIVREKGAARAIVVNAGIANACTGQRGLGVCGRTADCAARALGLAPEEVLLASTGVIGMDLPLDRICAGIGAMAFDLQSGPVAGHRAARAIMTTDTSPKEAAVTLTLDGKRVTIGGMAKGSGMIHPDMCTMLCFITSDCAIEQSLLQQALATVVPDTFNMISVDGDTSTNDTCLLLANGQADNRRIDRKNEDYEAFVKALSAVCGSLARQMAADGEGASCLFEVKVRNARSDAEARILAKSVVTSSLTKAAIYGHDANWGRILCALGYSGVDFDPDRVDLYFSSEKGKIQLVKDGLALDYSEAKATEILTAPKVTAICDMKQGDHEATAWGCDLTHDYVTINADYRS